MKKSYIRLIIMIFIASLCIAGCGDTTGHVETAEPYSESATESDFESELECEQESESITESVEKTETEIDTETESDTETISEAKNETQTETQTEIFTQTSAESENLSETENQTVKETESESFPEFETEAELLTETDTDPKTETETGTETETEYETEGEDEIKAREIVAAIEGGDGIKSGIHSKELIFNSVRSRQYVLKLLRENGYSSFGVVAVKGAAFSVNVLVRDDRVVTVWYNATSLQMRITVESMAHNHLSALQPNENTDMGMVTVAQVGIERGDERDNPNIGMCYVIKLSNGRAIIVDGGFNNDRCADNLYATLRKLDIAKTGDGKFIIEAWIFTHAHADHIGAAKRFIEKYRNKSTVTYYMHNFPGDDSVAVDGGESEIAFDNLFRSAYPEAKRVNAHAGLNYYFGNATVSMLYTPELIYSMDSTLDYYNNTSLIFKLSGGDASVLFLGDAGEDVATAIRKNYDARILESDILQITHHALYTGASEGHAWKNLKYVYDSTHAKYAFLPMNSRYGKDSGTRNGRFTVLIEWSNAKFQASYVMNEKDKPSGESVSQEKFDSFIDSVIAGTNEYDTLYGYDGINKIINEQGMTTYTSGSNYQAMITLFDFLGGEVTVTLNDELADWLRE